MELYEPVPDQVYAQAVDTTLAALRDPQTASRVAAYYTVDSNYAGATFAGLQPNAVDAITATDLLATSTLSVDIPILAVRKLLQDNSVQADVTHTLAGLPDKTLAETTDEEFVPMEAFYGVVKSALAQHGTATSNPWVTASKLVARKRPTLFPVRDATVCDHLGIRLLKDCRRDWAVFRHLMQNDTITQLLNDLPARVAAAHHDRHIVLDTEPLRLLDVALWQHAQAAD